MHSRFALNKAPPDPQTEARVRGDFIAVGWLHGYSVRLEPHGSGALFTSLHMRNSNAGLGSEKSTLQYTWLLRVALVGDGALPRTVKAERATRFFCTYTHW